jgi:hypothetical protein
MNCVYFCSSTYYKPDPDIYAGPLNTGPLYMSNGKMALLIVASASVLISGMIWVFQQRRRDYNVMLDERDAKNVAFYDERKREALSSGRWEAHMRRRAEEEREREMEMEKDLFKEDDHNHNRDDEK